MVDQRHDVICRLAVAEAARPGMATARLTLTEASPVCVTARIERWSLPRAPDVPMRRRADAGRASTLIRGTGTGGRAGALARSGRCVAAGLLLAFATLLALPLQAQAQTVWTSNLGQTKAVVYTTTQPYTVTRAAAAPPGTVLVGNFDAGADAYPSRTQRVAQRFTTGANASGYTLTSVEVESADRQRDTFSAKVCTVTGSDQPTSTCTDLTAPTRFALGNIVFTVAGGMTLSTRTNYTVVLTPESGKTVTYGAVGNSAEDSNSLSKWIIANEYRFESATSWQVDSYSLSLKIRVRGSENTTTSTDATLSALTVNDGTNDLSLSPAFALGTYAYAANVGNGVTSVTLTATPNHTGGSVTGVTLGGTAIADTDFTNGITVPSLVEGDNVIVVTVTAEDTSTQAYTVTVTRAAASTDATLSALALKDGSTAITLSPRFSSTVTTYTALVANAVDEITIVPEVNESNATYEIQDSGGTALADADDMEDGFQVDLDVGANTIEVEVTAEDTTTMETYTVVATRAAASSLTATLETPDYVVGGNLQYRFDLKLTEAVAIPNLEMRNHAFSVTNGRMVKAKRIHVSAGGSNHWRMTVEPYDETKPVTVTLRGNRACSAQGALCTGGGDHVTNSPTLTLSAETLTLDSGNLPRVSIENATARENDAWLSFTVKLSRKAAQTVAVDFKTISGGTATEGADYRAQDYRVLFTPGETSIEAGVALIADTVDDIGETVKAEIANARVITARGAELGPLTIRGGAGDGNDRRAGDLHDRRVESDDPGRRHDRGRGRRLAGLQRQPLAGLYGVCLFRLRDPQHRHGYGRDGLRQATEGQ